MASGVDTHTHMDIPTHKPKQFQATRHALAFGWHAPGLKSGIEIKSEKYANKLEIKKVWKQVKDGAQ